MTAFPDVTITPLDPHCDFALIACDGLWDCRTSEEAIDWCHANIYKGKFVRGKLPDADLRKGVEAIVDASCVETTVGAEGIGCDNITAVLVEFLS